MPYEEEEKTSTFIIAIPVIVAVVLLAVAVTIVVKCYQNKKKQVQMIQQNVRQDSHITDQSDFQSQYVLKADDDKSIFARTSVISVKQKINDEMSIQSPERSASQMNLESHIDDQSHSSNSIIKFQSCHKEGQAHLGDELGMGDTQKKLNL